ncbi:hypothetical protein lerEdw1_005386 [Lerista edwardsae]|nr:hypothetical protein lerEdw1_005386 [Lerista edwardsae]
MTMTANKNASVTRRAGGSKVPRDTLDRSGYEHNLATSVSELAPVYSYSAFKMLNNLETNWKSQMTEDKPVQLMLLTPFLVIEKKIAFVFRDDYRRKNGFLALMNQISSCQMTAVLCQSVSPPPLLYQPRSPTYPLSDSEDSCRSTSFTRVSNSRVFLKDRTNWGVTLRSTSTSPSDTESPTHPLKAVSIGCLDKRLSIFQTEDQKEAPKAAQDGEVVDSHLLTRSTLSLGTAGNLRNLSLSRVSVHSQALDIRQKISEWECRKEPSPRMSVCLDKRDVGDRSGSEGCPSMLPSPCSEKTFDYKGFRRMSRTFSECSYPETEEEEFLDRDSCHRFEKRPSRSDSSNVFLKGHARKESSAVLNRIQKIEQALKEQPGRGLPQLPSSCYSVDRGRKKSVVLGIADDLTENATESKAGTAPHGSNLETPPETEKTSKTLQGLDASSSSVGPQLPPESLANTAVNPVPKPKRTFEYEADKNHKSKPSNGLPPSPLTAVPPPLPSTPAPPVTRRQKKESRFHRKSQNSTLSSCSHAVVALLYPFSWQHTFIPVLPSSMIDIVCCPTPFLVGLLSSSLPKLKELPVEEALMVNLGSDRFIRKVIVIASLPDLYVALKIWLQSVESGLSCSYAYSQDRHDKGEKAMCLLLQLQFYPNLDLIHISTVGINSSSQGDRHGLLDPGSVFVCYARQFDSRSENTWRTFDFRYCKVDISGLIAGSCQFIASGLLYMDDEDTLLPRKLQAALEQALERKNDLINQDSDSESDEECSTLNGLVSEVFIRFFVETIGHYSLFLTQNEKAERVFQREAFRKSVASKSIRRFLEVFMESQMFAGFIQDRELRKCRAKGLFEQRVEQYLEELPDTEQSGVNKFLRGLVQGLDERLCLCAYQSLHNWLSPQFPVPLPSSYLLISDMQSELLLSAASV